MILPLIEDEYDRSRRSGRRSGPDNCPISSRGARLRRGNSFLCRCTRIYPDRRHGDSRARQTLGHRGPRGSTGSRLLLARAANDEQASRIGNQTGGRVFLFLHTDDFWRDFHAYKAKGVIFVREPKAENYGTVAVFKDLYGNLWDLLQPNAGAQT